MYFAISSSATSTPERDNEGPLPILFSRVEPHDEKEGTDSLNNQSSPAIKIVSIGGGTGLSRLLSGLKIFVQSANLKSTPRVPTIEQLTAVVTVTDDSGSTGRLGQEFQIPPPGDIRKCMLALSQDERLMSKLFNYRFSEAGDLSGYSFGNLFLTALTEITGDFLEAIRLCSEVLAIKGRILPSSMEDIRLAAEMENGDKVSGQSSIGRVPERISKIAILPESPEPLTETLEAIQKADIITLGPGSLFTSLLPNLLVRGIPQAIARSQALKVYVGNIMTQGGETPGFTMAEHLQAVSRHLGHFPFDVVLCNHSPIPDQQQTRYREENAEPVRIDFDNLAHYGVRVVSRDLLARDKKVRHDPHKLALAIFDTHMALNNPQPPLRPSACVQTWIHQPTS